MLLWYFLQLQELAEKVQEVVEPLRDQLDAVVVFPSMPEVMRLNKVGSFTMQNLGQSKSVVSDFMKKKKKVRACRLGRVAWCGVAARLVLLKLVLLTLGL